VRLLLGGGRVCRMVLLVLGRICALHESEGILDVVCKISHYSWKDSGIHFEDTCG
jgi:hypothetical protein